MSTTNTENTTYTQEWIIIKGDKVSTEINKAIAVTDALLNDGTSIQDYEDFLDITDNQRKSIIKKIENSIKNTNYKSQYKTLPGVTTDAQAKQLAIPYL